MKWLGAANFPRHCVRLLLAADIMKTRGVKCVIYNSLRFCHSSAYSPLMMQNDTKCAALGGTYTDFITRYF